MKEIITISIEKDLVDKLPPSPGRSAFVESAIRSALNMNSAGINHSRSNVTLKNMSIILNTIDEHRYIQKSHLMNMIYGNFGIGEKSFVKYVYMLAYNKRIIDQNGWLVSLAYSGPMPWTDEGIRMRTKKRIENTVNREETKEEEVDDILNAEVSSDVRE